MSLRRLAPLFALVLASGAIAAGCGGDDNGDDNAVTVPSISVPTVTDAKGAQEAVETAKSNAYDACINAVDQVPEAQQDQARAACQQLQQ